MGIIASQTRTVRRAAKDLVEIVYYDHAHITLDSMREDLRLYDRLVPKNRVKKLVVLGRHTRIDLDVRKWVAEENRRRKSRIIAEAFVARSTAVRLAVNMYILFLNKEFPVRIFSSIDQAAEWLRSIDS